MREICRYNLSVDEWLERLPPEEKQIAIQFAQPIRNQKNNGNRPLPSRVLIDRSKLLTSHSRHLILDAVACLVDENCFGRSEMCKQFAELLQKALQYVGLPARAVLGTAYYYKNRKEIYHWEHAWVRLNDEVIDGNADCLSENPIFPKDVSVAPYWGPIKDMPSDRFLREDRSKILQPDEDVKELWWPDLKDLIDKQFKNQGVP